MLLQQFSSHPVLLIFSALVLLSNTTNAQDSATQEQRFTALEQSLTGTILEGHFTDSNDAETSLRAERYELKKVQHVKDDYWLFQARIKYGENDVTLPLTLPVKWAGDTPVVSIDKFPVPGLGTYTARVIFYADHYAGFWSGADHGGHLFGKIIRPEKESAETKTK